MKGTRRWMQISLILALLLAALLLAGCGRGNRVAGGQGSQMGQSSQMGQATQTSQPAAAGQPTLAPAADPDLEGADQGLGNLIQEIDATPLLEPVQ